MFSRAITWCLLCISEFCFVLFSGRFSRTSYNFNILLDCLMTYIVYSDRHRLNSDNVNIHLPDHETQTVSQNTNWDVENLVKEWAELKKSLLYLSYIYIILWTEKKLFRREEYLHRAHSFNQAMKNEKIREVCLSNSMGSSNITD